jgi:di/tricarboxylate transporter
MEKIKLSGGDSVLLSMEKDRIREIEQDHSFVIVSEVELPNYRTGKMPLALAILAGVVAAAAFNVVPIVVSALVGSVLLIFSGCLTTEEAYQAISWKVILLLAGIIPLGLAMEKTGVAELLSTLVISLGDDWGPTLILSALFFLTMMLTNVMSNQAAAVLLAPLAIQTAHTLGVSARPFLMAVTFAASLSFMTPVGYQTNTLIYAPGQYKFTDFTRVGTPLNLLFWIIATLLIPVFWPF